MNEFTYALEIDYEKKSEFSLKYPTFNFTNCASICTWLDARRIAQLLGKRFQLRLHNIMVVYGFMSLVMTVILLASFGKYIPLLDYLEIEHVVTMMAYWLLVSTQLVHILFNFADMNVQTNNQIRQFIKIRELILRIVVQPDVIKTNPHTIPNRVQQIVIQQLRNKTKHLKGEEKTAAMEEGVKIAFEMTGTAID